MKKSLKESPKVLGLDVSTRTIGWALFDIQTQQLLELTHISPVPKPKEEDKMKKLEKCYNCGKPTKEGLCDICSKLGMNMDLD